MSDSDSDSDFDLELLKIMYGEERTEKGPEVEVSHSESDSTKLEIEVNDPSEAQQTPRKEINILLLGETGVGKSTFINAFANYLTYETLEEAKSEEMIALIPSSFTLTNEDYEEICVRIGDDKNECMKWGKSATQSCKCYVFPFGHLNIRLIDTPGVGDTRGIDQDRLNFDNILSFIGQYPELHCICILLKPNNSRITVMFEFCIKQLLCHLQKTASENIVFTFTNARGTFYRPGDTAPALREILKDIKESPPFVEIPLKKNTIYCVDNEAFRFLVAIKNGIKFDENEIENFSKSWTTSVNECERLMKYILGSEEENIPGLQPHMTQDTITVNEVRRQILSLSQSLAEITQNIEDNLKVMESHRSLISNESTSIDHLKENLYIPFVDLEITELPEPRTVCAAANCCEVYEVAGLKKYNFVKKCHGPCRFARVPKDVLGDPGIRTCFAFGKTDNCKVCGCSYLKHLHIYYQSTVVERRVEDPEVKKKIKSKNDVLDTAQKMMEDIEVRSEQIKSEKEAITQATAKFAHFLKNNAIAPYNDAFQAYIEHLIINEESLSGRGANNRQIIDGLNQMLLNYKQEKDILDKALADSSSECVVTAEDVFKAIESLYCLEIYGNKIKEMQQKKKVAQNAELFSSERETVYKPPESRNNGFFGPLVNSFRSLKFWK